jgi:hypothetical protein
MAGYTALVEWWLDSANPSGIRRAARWMPFNAEAWRLMVQVEPEQAAGHWRRVLRWAPYDTEARYALAAEAEAAGRAAEGEALLLEAAQVDRGYLPAWTLANFYLRQGNDAAFWQWARRAASFEVDLQALLELGLRLKPDPAALARDLAVARPAAFEQLLVAAGERGLLAQALPIADRVARNKTPNAAGLLLSAAEKLLATNDAAAIAMAHQYWELAARDNLLPYEVAPAPGLVNGRFVHESLERGFDWRAGSAEVPLTTGGGLRAVLLGKQEDTAILARQRTVLEPGRVYELRYRYRVELPAFAHPIRWQQGAARSAALEPGEWREAAWQFTAGQAKATELLLVSQREPGTRRAEGQVELAWVVLEVASAGAGVSNGTGTMSTSMGAAPKKPTSKL